MHFKLKFFFRCFTTLGETLTIRYNLWCEIVLPSDKFGVYESFGQTTRGPPAEGLEVGTLGSSLDVYQHLQRGVKWFRYRVSIHHPFGFFWAPLWRCWYVWVSLTCRYSCTIHKPGSFVWPFRVCFNWSFKGSSDLHLGDQKITWKKLVHSESGCNKSDTSTTLININVPFMSPDLRSYYINLRQSFP